MCLKSSGEITYQFLPIMPSPPYSPSHMLFHPFHHRRTLQGGRGDTARHIVVVTRPQGTLLLLLLPTSSSTHHHYSFKPESSLPLFQMQNGRRKRTPNGERRAELNLLPLSSPPRPFPIAPEAKREGGGERLASRVRGTCVPCSFPFLFGTINTGREVGGEEGRKKQDSNHENEEEGQIPF